MGCSPGGAKTFVFDVAIEVDRDFGADGIFLFAVDKVPNKVHDIPHDIVGSF
jgi:hypothetical protein